MNKERYDQIINKAYDNYYNYFSGYEDIPNKELFLMECRRNKNFSEKWGLNIEEHELNINERLWLFKQSHPDKSINDFRPNGMEVQSIKHQLETRYDNAGIPRKLVTISYNNEKMGYYE